MRALAFADVDALAERFERLNSYDRHVVPGSILKQEHVQYDVDGARATVEAFAISAKRYVLFQQEPNGSMTLLKVSEHGLGHLLDPVPGPRVRVGEDEVPAWIVELWRWLIARELGDPVPDPAWFARPALARVTLSTVRVAIAFERLNANKAYTDRIKLMNFVLSAQVAPFGHPEGADPTKFHLLAPYERDADRWATLLWINKYTGDPVEVTTAREAPPHVARIQTMGDVACEYAVHPEPKAADAVGLSCGLVTRGLLQRRHRCPGIISHIGKEANCMEEVEAGMVHHVDEVRTTYGVRDTWDRDIVPSLNRLPAARLAKWGRCSVRTIKNLRNGHTRPSPGIRRRLERAMARWRDGVAKPRSKGRRRRIS